MKKNQIVTALAITLTLLVWGVTVQSDEIHEAAKEGDVEKVETLLRANPKLVNSTDDNPPPLNRGETPLHWAARMGRVNVVEVLLANKADINAKSKNGQTPLHDAAAYGNKKVVEVLLTNKADINAKREYGLTPLHVAAYEGQKGVVEVLLANKADINAKNDGGETALDLALSKHHDDIAEVLRHPGEQGTSKVTESVPDLIRALENEDVSTRSKAAGSLGKIGDKSAAESLRNLLYDPDENVRKSAADALKQINAPVTADELKKDGKFQEAFNQYMADFKTMTALYAGKTQGKLQEYRETTLRKKIIELALEMKPAPAIPEEARRHYVIALTLFEDANNIEDVNNSIEEFKKALLAAPWRPEANLKLAVALKAAQRYDEAIGALKLYISTNPGEKEARSAQDEIYILEAKQKKAAKEKVGKDAVEKQKMEQAEAERREQERYGWISGRWIVTEKLDCPRFDMHMTLNPRTVEFIKSGDIVEAYVEGDITKPLGLRCLVSDRVRWQRNSPDQFEQGRWIDISVNVSSDQRRIKYTYPGFWQEDRKQDRTIDCTLIKE